MKFKLFLIVVPIILMATFMVFSGIVFDEPESEWNQTYGGASTDGALSFVETGDGGYALAGYTRSYGAGRYDFWLVKTDSNGVVTWNQTYGGASDDSSFWVIETSDEGYALTGLTESYGAGYDDIWLVKINTRTAST